MATYTAVIGDASSVGSLGFLRGSPTGTTTGTRRNPTVASARIRTIMAPHIIQATPGGLISCDFTIPSWEAQRYRSTLRYGATVWLFDGATPIFYGYAEQPTWNPDGSCLMNVSGPWTILSRAQMREAWELWDMSLLNPGANPADNGNGQVNLANDGSLRLSFGVGSAIALNDRVSVEYVLFGEAVGNFDGKLISAFEVDIATAAFSGSANLRFRVIGCTAPGASGTTLYDTNAAGSSGIQGALNLHGTGGGAGVWGGAGFRCLRFQLVASGGAVAGGATANSYVVVDRIRIGTREALFPVAGSAIDTAAIARDIININTPSGSFLAFDTPQEFWPSQVNPGATDTNSEVYQWGLDPMTGTGAAPNSGVTVTGFTALEWQDPASIIAALAAIDGCNVGFYLPYNGRGGYDPPGSPVNTAGPADVGSMWLSAPPQLYYQAFPDPNYSPDYTIHTREGAQVDSTTQAQPMLDSAYVNYQNLRGRQLSVVQNDASTLNYLYAQGFRRAEDYTIQPSVGDSVMAATLGQQMMTTRRQPYASATITIQNDGSARYPILKAGAMVTKLATVRPGSMRISDVPAAGGLRSGYATEVEWWGQTLQSPETIQITLGQPGKVSQTMAHGKLANRIHRERRRIL